MKKDIRNLLLVMGVAIVAAVGVTGWFLIYYGPSGRYLVENTLLRPDLLSGLNYNDLNPKTGQMDRYVFDKIVYNDKEIPVSTYAQFYQMIEADDSVKNPPLELFSHPSRLIIKVRTESSTEWQKDTKNFLEIDIARDYYRIELHEDKSAEPFVYFYHPKIYQEVTRLFE